MESCVSSSPLLEDVIRQLPGYDPYAMAGDCWFSADDAQLAIDFFQDEQDGCLRHVEGGLAGERFKLELWQQAIIANLFGWKRIDEKGREVRRYREAFIYVPRKNGKTPLAAGICLLALFCDGEAGAQIYSAAAEREQASYLFRQAKGMVERDPVLSSKAKIFGGIGHRSIQLKDDTASVYKVLSADADTKHGGNSHLVLIDELHAQPNRDLVDVLQTSLASANRKQPMLIHITTADFDRESICNEKHNYACKVRDNGGDPAKPGYDPSFLPVIYEVSADDDWTKEEVWAKANPNLGVSVSLEYLRRECKRAVETPTYQNTFKRLHLNIKTTNDAVFLDMAKWAALPAAPDPVELIGKKCFGAFDLSTTTDLTAFVLVFPPNEPNGIWHRLPFLWVPRENAEARQRRDRVPYSTWIEQGHIRATDGNTVDYDVVRRDINQLGQKYQITSIARDRWNATQISTQLMGDGFEIIDFGQGFASMSAPTKELEKLVMAGRLSNDQNPALTWMAGNTAVETDAAGNLKPSKKKSTDRIDGMVALIMALGIAIAAPQDTGPQLILI